MLPAKFRGLASRMGRLALNSFTAHKNHQTDGVREHQCANSTASVASASASADSDYHSNCAQIVSVDARTAHASRACRTSRTFRTFRTLRRAIFAMLVAAATLFATFVVPAQQANAYDVYWRYGGVGYLAATTEDSQGRPIGNATNNATSAERDVSVIPEIADDNVTVTWTVTFNPKGYDRKPVGSNYGERINDDRGENRPFGKNPTLYAFLPNGLDKNSIKVERTKYHYTRNRMYKTVLNKDVESPISIGDSRSCDFSNNSCDNPWNNSVGPGSGDFGVGVGKMSHVKYKKDNGYVQYSVNELYSWKNSGMFGVGFSDKQSLDYRKENTISPEYQWKITARFDNKHTADDFYKMPFVAGFTSEADDSGKGGNRRKNKFVILGPFDSDGDGIPDTLDYKLSMHPNDSDQIKYPVYEKSMIDDFARGRNSATQYGWTSNAPVTTYNNPITIKPFTKVINWGATGNWNSNWEGDPKANGGTLDVFSQDDRELTSTNLPTNIGIEYNLIPGRIPNGIKEDTGKQGSPCNVSRDKGCVKIDHKTGYVTYNPRTTDWNIKTNGKDKGLLNFLVKITYPAPGSYNLEYGNKRIEREHDLTIRVLSQASLYNPVYEALEDVDPTSKNTYTGVPTSKKDNSKKHNNQIRTGALPQGTSFTLKKYKNHNNDTIPGWVKIEDNDKNTGKIHVTPGKRNHGQKVKVPVVVKYPDGSTSEDEDSGNDGNPVYANITVKDTLGDDDVHLVIYKGQNKYNIAPYTVVTPNSKLHLTVGETMKPDLVLDSWAEIEESPIVFRAICYEEQTNGSKTNYKFLKNPNDTFNGLKFSDTAQWKHAPKQEQDACAKDNSKCKPNEYLYKKDYENNTVERSRALITGTPSKKGNFGCKVYAFHNNYKKLNDFDSAAQSIGASALENWDKQQTKEDIKKYGDMATSVFRFDVHSMAYWYNPQYKDVTVKAGNFNASKNITEVPKSVQTKYGDGRIGDLPKGTWFEIKKAGKWGVEPLSWSELENGESNKKNNEDKPASKEAQNKGRITFRPHKWMDAGEYKTPVIVHYPDGSKSNDDDAGTINNGGNIVYSNVTVTREKVKDGDLHLNVYNKSSNNRYVKDKAVTTMLVDSWSTYKPGIIHQRMLCYKLDENGNPIKNSYHLGGINGLTLAGPNNDSAPKKWKHAVSKTMRNSCNKSNGTGCNISDYLYDYDVKVNGNNETTERTNGYIKGTPTEYGDFVCKVYALKDLPNKGDYDYETTPSQTSGQLQKRFDDAINGINAQNADQKLQALDNVLNSKPNPNAPALLNNKQGIDWSVSVINISVHPDAYYYNPTYDDLTIQAGTFNENKNITAVPYSNKDGNGVSDKEKGDIVVGALPKGTWFEIKRFVKSSNVNKKNAETYPWANFEEGQSNSKTEKNKKVVNDKDAQNKGRITFRPDKWQDADDYLAEVVVHYPDGSTSDGDGSINKNHPVYAKVKVTCDDKSNRFGLDLYEKYEKKSDGKYNLVSMPNDGLTLKNGESLPNDATFDSYLTKSVGPIHLHMICSKKVKDGNSGTKTKQTEYTYNRLPGHSESDGLRLKKQTIWGHATLDQQKSCIKDSKACTPDKLLYDDWVPGGNSNNTAERTRGFFNGKAQKAGDYECKVYAIKGDQKKSDAFANAVKANIEKNKKARKDEDPVPSVLNASGNPYGTEGVGYKTGSFSVHIHNDAHYYNPQYVTLTMEAGTKQATEVPKSKKNANDANTSQDDVREGDLPDGTWFKFKKPLSYTFFEDDQDNKAKNSTGKFGKVTFRPHKWFPVASDKVQVIVHYPDGSTSEDKDSGNNGKPIYAKVNITRSHDEDAGNLQLSVTDHEGGTNWSDTTITLSKDEELNTAKKTTRWLDSWSKYKPGQINLRTICHRVNPDSTKSRYQSGGIAGIKMQDVKQWNHTEKAADQKACEKDASQCHPDRQLYDDYIANGNSKDTTERTRGWIKGKANESGDYECVVYAIKAKQFKTDNNDLLARFDAAVGALNKDASKNNTDPLKDFKWKLDGANGNKDAVKGVDYEYRTIPIHIHNDAHFYNPVYENVTVQAGGSVETAVPSSKKPAAPANNPNKYDYIKEGSFPDGTWFEFKTEKGQDGVTRELQPEWAYWGTDNNEDQSNKPDNPKDPNNHKGKHSEKGDGAKYGKITFNPDLSIKANSYKKYVVVHYPDGSTSEDPDAGNNQFKASEDATSTMNSVFAPVTVMKRNNFNDLQMELLRSEDADPQHDSLSTSNPLTVMSGTSLTKNPYVRAWSVTNKNPITFRMLCTKDGQKWSRGLDDSLNMHLDDKKGGYGEFVEPWPFATREQRIACSMNDQNCYSNLLYGFTKGTGPLDKVSAVARSEVEISGIPQQAGTYTCSVYALKGDRVENVGNDKKHVLGGNLDKFQNIYDNATKTDSGKYITGIDWSTLQPTQGVFNEKHMGAFGDNWQRITFKVNVIDPPKFALPKTGGEGMSMALLVVAIIGMCVMCGAFFVDQTKWGHAMLAGAAAGMMCGLRGVARGITANVTRNSNGSRNSNRNSNGNVTRNSKISEIWRGLVKKVKNIRRFDDYSASVKGFVRKVTGWLRAALRRVGRWATERWRC